jgi:hypothetical protein
MACSQCEIVSGSKITKIASRGGLSRNKRARTGKAGGGCRTVDLVGEMRVAHRQHGTPWDRYNNITQVLLGLIFIFFFLPIIIAIWSNIYFLDPIVIFALNFSRKIQLLLLGSFAITYIYVILKCNIYSNKTIALMALILLDVGFQQIIVLRDFFLPTYFHSHVSFFRIFLNSLPQANGFLASLAQFMIRLIVWFLTLGHIAVQLALCHAAIYFICKTRACINPVFAEVYRKKLDLAMCIWVVLLVTMMFVAVTTLP